MRAMFVKCRAGRLVALVVVALAFSIGAGCSLDDPSAPALTSPSGFSTAVTLTAFPDNLPRDGSSESIVTVTVRDASNRPVSGQRLSVSTDIGSVTESEVVTDGDGRATFAFVAPESSVSGIVALISVTPLGENADTVIARTLTIRFTGATNLTAPTPSFTMSPTAPVLRQTVVLDASATTDESVVCADSCTYSWNFDGEATATGRVVTYQFLAIRTYPITLTVTDAQGSSATLTQNLVVTQGTAPTASFTFSPTSPGLFETVRFTAEASRVGETSRTITRYEWKFGDGESKAGITESHTYSVLGSYPVVLTVTDSAGVQGTSTTIVTVVEGVTATFTFSNPVDGSLEVVFNAEESRGSDSGFGGRNTISEYIWHFGIPGSTDREETTSPIIRKTFPVAAIYTVTLTVEDSAGRRETSNQSVTVVD